MADLYEEMLEKQVLFSMICDKIFKSVELYKYIDSDKLFKGFFFLFIYKDFILREIIR
jgi:hypothetical protein